MTTSPGPSARLPTAPGVVGLVVHGGRPEAREAALAAVDLLREEGVGIVGCSGDGWDGAIDVRDPSSFGDRADVVVVFGGDGTFLRAAYMARDQGLPLAGVDLGRLGFLSEVAAPDVRAVLRRLVDGAFTVEERMTLLVEVDDADGRTVAGSWALNEASIERTDRQRLVVLEVRVGDAPFAHVPADGIICASPTGSTAYAFSAGGPILSPLVDAILLVPVAPHSLFDRTIVVDPAEMLSVRPVGGHNTCLVSLDGRETLDVPAGGRVRVSRGEVPVRLARFGTFDFYERVRDKFGLH
ncbi:MAG: NAD(+)/NADH kinase [Actinomycetota bacterium]|nr:NAD(+)/NADH kinase [Actinomycetota bacterium]